VDLTPYYTLYRNLKKQYGEDINDQRYKLVVVRKRLPIEAGSLVPMESDLVLNPLCKVESLPEKMAGKPLDSASNDVVLTQSDLLVSGIPRTYTEAELTENVRGWIIGATLNEEGTKAIAGKFYFPVFLLQGNMLSWEMVLRKPADPVVI